MCNSPHGERGAAQKSGGSENEPGYTASCSTRCSRRRIRHAFPCSPRRAAQRASDPGLRRCRRVACASRASSGAVIVLGVDRPGVPEDVQVAEHRPRSRWPLDRHFRREGPAERRLLRRHRRRPVEDDGQGRDVGAGHRRPDPQFVGRRGRRVRNEHRRSVHRHGRIVYPRQHPAGRRRLQVARCGQDVDARRLPRLRRDFKDPDRSEERRYRLRRGLRQVRHAQR